MNRKIETTLKSRVYLLESLWLLGRLSNIVESLPSNTVNWCYKNEIELNWIKSVIIFNYNFFFQEGGTFQEVGITNDKYWHVIVVHVAESWSQCEVPKKSSSNGQKSC